MNNDDKQKLLDVLNRTAGMTANQRLVVMLYAMHPTDPAGAVTETGVNVAALVGMSPAVFSRTRRQVIEAGWLEESDRLAHIRRSSLPCAAYLNSSKNWGSCTYERPLARFVKPPIGLRLARQDERTPPSIRFSGARKGMTLDEPEHPSSTSTAGEGRRGEAEEARRAYPVRGGRLREWVRPVRDRRPIPWRSTWHGLNTWWCETESGLPAGTGAGLDSPSCCCTVWPVTRVNGTCWHGA